jgi:hypothetical protein
MHDPPGKGQDRRFYLRAQPLTKDRVLLYFHGIDADRLGHIVTEFFPKFYGGLQVKRMGRIRLNDFAKIVNRECIDRTGRSLFSGYDGIRHDYGLVAGNQIEQKPACEARFYYIYGWVAEPSFLDFAGDGDADAVVTKYGIAESKDECSLFQK